MNEPTKAAMRAATVIDSHVSGLISPSGDLVALARGIDEITGLPKLIESLEELAYQMEYQLVCVGASESAACSIALEEARKALANTEGETNESNI